MVGCSTSRQDDSVSTPTNTVIQSEPEVSSVSGPISNASSLLPTSINNFTVTSMSQFLPKLPSGWYNNTVGGQTHLCRIASVSSTNNQPVHISHCIVIRQDFSWELYVHGHRIHHEQSTIQRLSAIPNITDNSAILRLISILDLAYICHGYPKLEYIEMFNSRHGVFTNTNGTVRAQIYSTNPVVMRGKGISIYYKDCRLPFWQIYHFATNARSLVLCCAQATHIGLGDWAR